MATTQADIQNKIKNIKEFSDEEFEIIEILRKEEIAEEIKQSSEEDLESLLKLAEELREKIENPRIFQQILLFRIMQGLAGSLLLFDFYSLFFKGFSIFKSLTVGASDFSILFTSMLYIILFFILGFFETLIRDIRKDSIPNKLALKEVLQLLREVHGTIAEREDWSILKRAEFRIRLSRFDLSEKKESVFNFFS